MLLLGLTNKLLSKIATRLLEAFPETFSTQRSGIADKLYTTGNPIRTSFSDIKPYDTSSPLKLLVVGGSRGAMALNQLIPKILVLSEGQVTVWHQTGIANIDACRKMYDELPPHLQSLCRVAPFIDDMAQAYEWANIVLCRSGALTVAELAAAGRPSILIPFPYAVDDHQTANGRYLVDKGAAFMIQQQELSENALTTLLLELGSTPERLRNMAASAKLAGQLKATHVVANHCEEVCGYDS